MVGILLASPLASRLGYKITTLLMLVASTGFVAIPFFAPTVEFLMAGFFLQGIPWGVYQIVSPVYASEVASLQLRPILTTWNNLCWVLGQLIASGITKAFDAYDGHMSFRIPLAIQAFFSVVLSVAISFTPESPYWYLQKGRLDDARRATQRLVRKGSPVRAEKKLALMLHTISQEARHDAEATVIAPEKQGRWLGKLHPNCLRGTDMRRTEIASMTWLIQSTCGASLVG